MKRTYKVTVESTRRRPEAIKCPAERAFTEIDKYTRGQLGSGEQRIKNIETYTKGQLGDGRRGPRRNHVKHFNEGVERFRSGRSS